MTVGEGSFMRAMVIVRHRPEQIMSLYRGVPGKDPSYMYRLAFRQNVSLVGGAVLAVREEVYSDWVEENLEVGTKKWNGWGAFSDQTWLFFLPQGEKALGRLRIYAVCILYEAAGAELAPEAEMLKGESGALASVFCDVGSHAEKEDPHGNPGMNIFGKYYFLGKSNTLLL